MYGKNLLTGPLENKLALKKDKFLFAFLLEEMAGVPTSWYSSLFNIIKENYHHFFFKKKKKKKKESLKSFKNLNSISLLKILYNLNTKRYYEFYMIKKYLEQSSKIFTDLIPKKEY